MEKDDYGADAPLFARMRGAWEQIDPVPEDLADRMVATVAVQDLTREYALLTLVESVEMGAVRGDADTSTLQFTDGRTSVLLHIAAAQTGARRRIDGWADPAALAVRLIQGERAWTAESGEQGRFAFDEVPSGLSRLRLVIRQADGELSDFQTPQFEV